MTGKKVSKYDKYKQNNVMDNIIDAIYMYDMQTCKHANIQTYIHAYIK